MVFETTIVRDLMSTYTAIVIKEEDLFVAKCPELGTASQGKTIEAAVFNLKEASEIYLEEFPNKSTSKPILTTFEVKVLAKDENIGKKNALRYFAINLIFQLLDKKEVTLFS